MIFHPKGKHVEPYLHFEYNNNDLTGTFNPDLVYPIERIHNGSVPVPAYKLLEIFLDENLTFEYHVKQTLKMISKSMFSLSKVKNCCNY